MTHRYRQCSTGIMADCFGDSVQQQQCYQAPCPTEAPRTIITMPEEPARFSAENAFAPPRGGLGRVGNGEIQLSVEEFDANDEYGLENELYMGAQMGYSQFNGRENKPTWTATLMNSDTANADYFEQNNFRVCYPGHITPQENGE